MKRSGYIIDKVIGNGAFGTVYLAKNENDGNLYVLKESQLNNLAPDDLNEVNQ